MKELKINKISEYILKILIIISFVVIGLMNLSINSSQLALLNSFLILIVSTIILKRVNINLLSTNKLIVSLLIGLYVGHVLAYDIKNILIELLIYPSIVFVIYYWLEKHHPKVIKELKTLDKKEKTYLLIVGIITIVLVPIITIKTNVFQDTNSKNVFLSDVIYTSDAGIIYSGDAWFRINNPENDIRQPLFGLFALPISITAHIIAELLFIGSWSIRYGMVLSIIQILLLSFTVIMLARIIKPEEYQKKYFYLFFSLSFPYLLFGILIEQYVIALFYLILTIYQYEKIKEERNDSYLGAISTLVTSAVLFPLITKAKNVKDILKKYTEIFIIFLVLLILTGKLVSIISTLSERMNYLFNNFASNCSFSIKWNQYTTFIEDLFIIRKGQINEISNHFVYRLPVPKTMSIIGIIILIVVLISFIINRRERIAKISILWILYSFIILCIVGWGIPENGLILYSLYFSWAIYSLLFLLIKKVIKNKILFSIVMILLIGFMFIYTSTELFNIIQFGLKYYPR